MKLFKKAKKGFTLVELVVVIAVIAILSAVSVGAYFGITNSAKQSKVEQEGKAYHTNLVLIANTPNNGICKLTSTGLVFEDGKGIGDITAKIEADNGVSYTDYTITLKAPTSTHDQCIEFALTADVNFSVNYVVTTGEVCTGTHA